MARRNDLTNVDGDLLHETKAAYLFAPDGDEDRRVWIPKSISTWCPETDDSVTGFMEVPEWFAEKEGMV